MPCGSETPAVSVTGCVVYVDEGLDVRLLMDGAVFRSGTTLSVVLDETEWPWPSETVTWSVTCTFEVVYVCVTGFPLPVGEPSPKFHV